MNVINAPLQKISDVLQRESDINYGGMLANGKWFTIDQIDEGTYYQRIPALGGDALLSLNGSSRSLLIDTGLGICNIYDEVMKLTNKPVTAVATHIHWDHIGGHKYFPDFYAHAEELSWLNGEFPLTIETIREMVADRCDLPDGYDTGTYEFFQGTPTKVLEDGENIELGGRNIQVLHTPGHAPGHMCFWESDRGYLFTGDLVYKDIYLPIIRQQTRSHTLLLLKDFGASSQKVFPAHHSLDIQPEILSRMRNAFRQLREDGKLHHGSGTFDYGDWAVWL